MSCTHLLTGLAKSQSGATKRYPHLEIFRLALFNSIAEAEWSSFSRKQLEHLLLLKMFGANFRHSGDAILRFSLYYTVLTEGEEEGGLFQGGEGMRGLLPAPGLIATDIST
jgi:hypothetical protein